MKKALLYSLFLISAAQVFSQKDTVMEKFSNMRMRSIGPAVMSGRVTAIDAVEGHENIIFTGTASGGIWRSYSGGVEWEPVFDQMDVQGIGSICIDPSIPDVIWAGTGEGNPRNSHTSGAGIYRSGDGGKTWEKKGLEKTKTIHRVIVHPSMSDVVYAAAHGSAWGPTPDRGVYKTFDGGVNWEKVLFVNDSTGCADLVMDPKNPEKLFAAMYQYERKPYHFTSGGAGSGLYLTTDGGKKWKKLGKDQGLPEGNYGRIGIAISHTNSQIVYALIESESTGLYKSEDGGYHWQMVNDKDVKDRPFYYHEIYVDPSNSNHLIYLHSVVSESIDGGRTWKTILPYFGVHPDHHAMWWSKTNPHVMYEGNDGGMNITRDGGKTWTFINNLPLGQFYHVNYDMDVPYHVYGGLQDNGSWKGPAYTWHGDGIRDADWQEVLFGDGFDVMARPDNSRYVYAMYQGGELNYIDSETGDTRYIKPVHPDGLKLRFNWNAALAQDPNQACGVYYGSQFVHYSEDCGKSWKIISPDLTTNDSTKLKQSQSGGLTIDATAAENHCTILCITPSLKNKNCIWVGTDDGQIQLTKDHGKSWTNLTMQITGMPKNGWVPQIICGTQAEGEAFVVVNNYRQNDWKPYLFHTQDFGKTWKNLVSEKSISGHCLSFVQDPVEPKLLFLGTENGLYLSFDYGLSWHKWTSNYPSVATQDLKIHPRENDLIIATFGRALWILDDITPLRKYAREGLGAFQKKITALHTSDAYMSAYMQPKGERFPADMHYSGENKQGGARLMYYFRVDPKKEIEKVESGKGKKEKKENSKTDTAQKAESSASKTEEKKDEKVTVMIKTLAGDTIRTFKHEPDTGINILSWYYDTKGVRFPSLQEKKKDEEEPGGGITVAPGQYRVVYAYQEYRDSSDFIVKDDPRLTWDDTEYNKRKELERRMKSSVEEATKGMEKLKSMKKWIERIESLTESSEDSTIKSLRKVADSLKKEIGKLQELYFFIDGKGGIQDDSDKLVSKLYAGYGYVNNNSIGSNEENYLNYLEKEVKKVTAQIESFTEKGYLPWVNQTENVYPKIIPDIRKL
ncbi:MAG: hypothetical protein K1X54_01115 [Flavobacteriales bacterium]|nr:hypothetical protein [Flavobacteriales bacterium]